MIFFQFPPTSQFQTFTRAFPIGLPFRPSGPGGFVQAPHVDDAPCKIEIRHLCQVPAVQRGKFIELMDLVYDIYDLMGVSFSNSVLRFLTETLRNWQSFPASCGHNTEYGGASGRFLGARSPNSETRMPESSDWNLKKDLGI